MSIKYYSDPEILFLVLSDTECSKTKEQNHILIKPLDELSETMDRYENCPYPNMLLPLGLAPPPPPSLL